MFGHRKKAVRAGEDDPALVAQLAKVAFFDGFSNDDLSRVLQLAEEVVAETGAVLIDQGRVGQECFVILEGEAGVYVSGEHVATNGPGSMIGEMALIEHRPRNATVVAETEMRLLGFDTRAFKILLEEMPKAHDRVMETLAARLRARD
jgi:CRP/FNR family transcriptional regulator, cyclic AMP receptor protein